MLFRNSLLLLLALFLLQGCEDCGCQVPEDEYPWEEYVCTDEQLDILEREMKPCSEGHFESYCYETLKKVHCTPPTPKPAIIKNMTFKESKIVIR